MSLEDWSVNSDGSVEVECDYSSCCTWGTAYGTITKDEAKMLFYELKEHFEPEEKSE